MKKEVTISDIQKNAFDVDVRVVEVMFSSSIGSYSITYVARQHLRAGIVYTVLTRHPLPARGYPWIVIEKPLGEITKEDVLKQI